MGNDVFTVKQGAIFVQRSPSLDPEYYGCYDLADISGADGGDIDLIQAFDVNGNYETLGFTQQAPDAIKTTLTTYLDSQANYLERVKCPFLLHVNLRCAGVANVVNNYERAVVLNVAAKTGRTLKGLVMREGDDKAEQDFDLGILPPIMDVYKIQPDTQNIASVLGLNDVFFIPGELCGDCIQRYDLGSIGMLVADAADDTTAVVYYTLNGGSTWTACAAAPFAADEHVVAVTGFWLTGKVYRFVVARGVTDAGNPAEVAYTDFNLDTGSAIGAAWTHANVGAINGEFMFGPKSLFAYDQFNIWAVAGAGSIYKSSNGGLTWVLQDSGVASGTQDLYALRGVPGSSRIIFAAGENNSLARTRDGGTTWSAVAGPSSQSTDEILTLEVRNERTLFLGYNDGALWATYNGGITWTQIAGWTGSGVGQVRAIEFLNDVQGFMLVNNASPVGTMLSTRDCGRSWEVLTTPTNTGLNALAVISASKVFAVGEAGKVLATA